MGAPEAQPGNRQPVGLGLLFFTETWERFSYYGMRAILVLFLIAAPERGGWGWSVQEASHLYGWYTGLAFFTPVLGGALADRYLGIHRALLIGGGLIAAGHFSLALHTLPGFYIGLALIVAGTGLFKPNVSTLVGQLYGERDPRRDAGYTLFYMGINLGALLGPLVCGYLAAQSRFGWSYGFGAAGVGMLLGLLVYALGRRRYLGALGLTRTPPTTIGRDGTRAPLTTAERAHIAAIFSVAFFVIFFWLAFEQAGSSMSVFAERSTDRSVPGWLEDLLQNEAFPASWFLSVNPAFILILAPLFAELWRRLGAAGREPDAPFKMVIGLALLCLSFVALVAGARVSDQGVLVGPGWLVTAYFLQTCGELCVSPVGLSLVSRLAPLRLASMLMGVWFLSFFAANVLGGYVAGTLEQVARGELFHVLGGQADFFLIFVVSSALAGLLLAALRPRVLRLMEGRF